MPISMTMCLKPYTKGNVVGLQGRHNPRTIYEFTYNGVTQRIAVQVSENGYIVGAVPKRMKSDYD